MSHAPAPSRASLSFSISFGLLNIPVNGYTGTEDISIKREQYLADGRKVGQSPCVKNDDGSYAEIVSRSDIVKRFNSDNGLVDLADDEIDSVLSVTPGVADLLGVLDYAFLDNGDYVPNGKVWQIRAAKLGSGRQAKANPGGEKAFALLLAALEAEESFALIRFSRAGTVYLGALLPTGRLVGLYHEDEVREDKPLPEVLLSEAEVTAARALLATAKVEDKVTVLNDSVAKVAAYAAEKAAGVERPEVEAPAAHAPAADLIALLTASVEAAKSQKAAV